MASRSRFALVALVSLGGGCTSATVKVEEQDAFGRANGYWFEFEQKYDGESETWHSFVIANKGGLCKDVQRALPELSEAYEAWYESYDDYSNAEEYCENLRSIFESYADALDPLYRGGGNYLSLSTWDPSDDDEDPPEADEYPSSADADGDEPRFYGNLTYYEDNPWRLAAEAMDCSSDTTEWYYDWYEELEDAVEMFYLSDGNLVVEQKNDTKYRIVLEEGELEDDEGDNAGDIYAKGTFTHCPVEYEGYAYLYF